MEQIERQGEVVPRVIETVSLKRCPYCHDALNQRQNWYCQGCSTEHHFECAAIHKGCAVFGCHYQGRGPSMFFSEIQINSAQEWTVLRRVLSVLWLLFVTVFFVGFAHFIQWLLETPTEFSIAELVIISVH